MGGVDTIETLRFLGWEPHMSVLQVVSARIPLSDLPVPGVGGARRLTAKAVTLGDAIAIPALSVDMAISCDNLVAWERRLAGPGHLKLLHDALKRGGILGVVESRAPEGSSFRRMMEVRGLTEEHVIALAEVAGFVLVSRSAANAHRRPARMTLKFIKP